MKRTVYGGFVVALSVPLLMEGASLKAPDITVGRNLQTPMSILLPGGAPAAGLELTVVSADPARVLFAAAPDRAGAGQLVLKVAARSFTTPEFWVHGLAEKGDVAYTASAPDFGSATGKVTLAPAGIAIVGPFRLPSFPTTPRGVPAKISIVSALLDSSGKIVAEQQVAGGLAFDVTIANSDPAFGGLEHAKLKLSGGASVASTQFKPAGLGMTTLSPAQPPGFMQPAEMAAVAAAVDRPGLAITDEFTLGKDLQMLGVLCLGEAAPEGGLEVTLTSSDPTKLVLSPAAAQHGSGTLVLRVPAGELTAQYHLQALGESGAIAYKAEAKGFRHRIAKIALAPSGFILAYEPYGPPDEASVLRQGEAAHEAARESRRFYVSIAEAKQKPVNIAVYSAYLDPANRYAADITVQPLRPGLSPNVKLKSSNPAVGVVEASLETKPGTSRTLARFTPVAAGETIISIETPAGFSSPKNATAAPATIVP
jgi:hypothetical protein